MANKEQFLDRNGVSHFYLLIKNKLTTYFKTLFVSKKDGYDLSQNDFTNELKAKLENMDGSGSGGNGEDEIVIVNVETFDEDTMTGTISQETADILQNYTGDKPTYLSCMGIYMPFNGGENLYYTLGNMAMIMQINYNNLTCSITISEMLTLDESRKINTEYLPSYVDDVIEGYLNSENGQFYEVAQDVGDNNFSYQRLITGESGKLYVDLHTSHSYRWSGSTFVKLESSAGLTALTNTEIDEIIASVDSSTE